MRRLGMWVLLLGLGALLLSATRARAQSIQFGQVPPSGGTSTSSTVIVSYSGQYGQDGDCTDGICSAYYPYDYGITLGTFAITLDAATLTSSFITDDHSSCTYGQNVQIYDCEQSGTATGTVHYNVGTRTLAASINRRDGTGSVSTSYSFAVASPPPPVTIAATVLSGGAATVIGGAAVQSALFSVRNSGSIGGTAFLNASCGGSAIPSGTCAAWLREVYVGAGETVPVRVDFANPVPGGAGTVTLTATDPTSGSTLSSASDAVSVAAAPRAIVASPTLQTGADFERGLCPTVAVIGPIATQCGAIRVTHALPAVMAYGKTYAPTLAYYSDNVRGPYMLVDVTIPASQLPVDSVTLQVYDLKDDYTRQAVAMLFRKSYAGIEWNTLTRSRRLNTGDLWLGAWDMYAHNVEVEVLINGMRVADLKGQVAPTIEFSTPIKKGWTMLGLEQLNTAAQPDGGILWIGGDGSTRRYLPKGSGVWVARSLTSPDTIYQQTNGYWYRALPNHAKVVFDPYGRHYQTIDRFNRATTFAYVNPTAKSSLASITVPGGNVYSFAYPTGKTVITAPGGRTVQLVYSATTGDGIEKIVDPDSSSETFQYMDWGMGAADYALGGYIDKRGTRTGLNWEGYSRTLSNAYTTANATQVVIPQFQSRWGRGAIPSDGSVDQTLADYLMWDPNGNLTQVWVDSLGAIRKSVNAIGDSTLVEHGDLRFPALPTRVVHPNGFAQTTAYDARGHVASSTSWNPLGDGRNATARYAWDATWDEVTRIETPERVVTEMGYDVATGDRLWQQTGGATYRASFTYYSGTLAGRVKTSQLPTGEVEQYAYDALGNLSQVVSPRGITTNTFADAIGRDTLTVGPMGVRSRTRYNATGLVSDQWTAGNNSTMAESVYVHTDYDPAGAKLRVVRQAIPDTAHVGTLTDSWQYDAVGRDTVHYGVGGSLRVRYNPAGQVVWTNHGDSTQYDALGRRIAHLLPAVVTTDLDGTRLDDAGTQGAPADTETYTYDSGGGLTKADNRYAKIRRSYYPNGTLRRDSSGTRIEHQYDLDGRPVRLRHDALTQSQTAFLPDSVTYGYDPATGAVTDVIDPRGFHFSFGYDDAGRLRTRTLPTGAVNSFGYDADSRVSSNDGRPMTRDDAGHVLTAGSPYAQFTMTYSPLGTSTSFNTGGTASTSESFVRDAFGNIVSRKSDVGGMSDSRYGQWRYAYAAGRAHSSTKLQTNAPYSGQWMPDLSQAEADAFGNRLFSVSNSYAMRPAGGPDVYNWCIAQPAIIVYGEYTDVSRQTMVYDANNRLRFVTMHLHSDKSQYCDPATQHNAKDSTFVGGTAYRYDALGRRVWTQAKALTYYDGAGGTATHCCDRVMTATWDGSALLAEVQSNNYSGAAGTVIYTNGGSVDRPLSITRANNGCASFTIFTRISWRGLLDNGGMASTGANCTGQASNPTYWPEQDFGASRNGSDYDPAMGWDGSLLAPGQDETGLVYMRNRYYDPKTGQFSQEDPLGIAGGMNTYGYANGDPVNYADPFGLCPVSKEHPEPCPDATAPARAVLKIHETFGLPTMLGMAFGALTEGPVGGASQEVASEEEAIATASIRNEVLDMAAAEGRGGFQLTKGAVTGEEFSAMAQSFAGQGATLSKSGNALIGAGADATFVAKLPRYKTYGPGNIGRLSGNLTIRNSQGATVINAHIPISLNPAP